MLKLHEITSLKPFSSTQTLILDNISFPDAETYWKKKLMENTFLFPTEVWVNKNQAWVELSVSVELNNFNWSRVKLESWVSKIMVFFGKLSQKLS